MGGPENITAHFRLFENADTFKAFASETDTEKDAARYRREGFPRGHCDWRHWQYARVTICLFAWRIETRGEFFEVLMHEIAHGITGDVTLLSGPPKVETFVVERIIIPITSSMIYDPLRYQLQPTHGYDKAKKLVTKFPEFC